ncbi:MAG: hypothetical protein WD048_13955 [Chitinophagales bacterium]
MNILAYSSDGRALDSSDYKKEIDNAIKEADNGEVVSQKDMEKGL